jgi:BirA family transcriptional regulator, biotin operon repressor / biotin---[acetyl-CoA-carboxylase] ligase
MTGPLDVEWVRARLPGRRVDYFLTTSSTMTRAAALAREGCAGGTVVVAEEQTAGHGRLGRSWHSEPEAGLYASSVLRLPLPVLRLPLVTLALGLATVDAIALATGLRCDLRWPNDVLALGRKCAGILVEGCGDALVAGIGINANHERFPESLRDAATSLRLATGRAQSRELLLVALLESIDRRTALLVEAGPDAILREFGQASSYVHGRRVVVETGEHRLTGSTDGLDPAGFLILRTDSGARELILSGGVRPLEA